LSPLIIAGILGYVLGSFPTAYLVVRWKLKVDIRDAGSGNVGTLNSLQVTKSKLVGIVVLLVDVAKGLLAVVVAKSFLGNEFWIPAVAAIAAVVGHNFPIWLRFKGGRGLATAAGSMIAFGWPLILVWGAGWLVGFLPVRKVNIGNTVASVLTVLAVLVAPESVLAVLFTVDAASSDLRIFTAALMAVVLVRHIEPVREYLQERKRNSSQA
jgi:glycerol-3-phosphate acyltransferase PlsY